MYMYIVTIQEIYIKYTTGPTTKLNSANIYKCPVLSHIAKFDACQYYHLYGVVVETITCVNMLKSNYRQFNKFIT